MLIDALNEVSQSTEFNPSRHPDVFEVAGECETPSNPIRFVL